MATAEEQMDAKVKVTSKKDRPKFVCEYEFITNEDPKVQEGFRKIGIMLDAELKAEEEAARKSKTSQT